MNQNIFKYSFNKYGLEFIKYLLDPQNLITLLYFQLNQSIKMNAECGKQLVKHFTDLMNHNKYLYTSFSSHNYFILKYGIPDPENLIIDFYVYLDEQKNILDLYNLFKQQYKNVILYLELGILFILPTNITNMVNDKDFKFHYIIQVTVLVKDSITHEYEMYNKDPNINSKLIPKTNNFISLRYVGKGNVLCIHSEAIEDMKTNYTSYKTKKIGKFLNYNEMPTYFVNNYLEYYLENAV